jgi:hypothetical protein
VLFTAVRQGGSAPLTFQWSGPSGPIAGATGGSYTFTPTGTSDSGTYTVAVTSPGATDTPVSAGATIVVVASGGLWSPLDDPGLVAWWDARELSTLTLVNTDRVSRWATVNNPAIVAEQPNAALQATYSRGDLLTWPTQGGPAYSLTGAPVLGGKLIVGLWANLTADMLLFARGTYSPGLYPETGGAIDVYPLGQYGAGTGVGVSNALVMLALPELCVPGKAAFMNGVARGAYAGNPWDVAPEFMLGDATRMARGQGAAFVISTSNDAETRQKYEGFLAHRWVLAPILPVDHPYKNAPPLK